MKQDVVIVGTGFPGISNEQGSFRRATVFIVPGGRGSCRTKAKLGRSLSLPSKSLAGMFQPAARLTAGKGVAEQGGKVTNTIFLSNQKH